MSAVRRSIGRWQDSGNQGADMARRIIFAQNAGFYGNAEDKLSVDQWVDIDWKHKVFFGGTGEMQGAGPSYAVGLHTSVTNSIIEYGVIKNAEDRDWLQGAIDSSMVPGKPTQVLARIHQLGLRRDEGKGFTIEVLTGEDAEDQINKWKRENAIATLKEVWWLIAIGLSVLLWIIF